jgi:hypothetical protein
MEIHTIFIGKHKLDRAEYIPGAGVLAEFVTDNGTSNFAPVYDIASKNG